MPQICTSHQTPGQTLVDLSKTLGIAQALWRSQKLTSKLSGIPSFCYKISKNKQLRSRYFFLQRKSYLLVFFDVRSMVHGRKVSLEKPNVKNSCLLPKRGGVTSTSSSLSDLNTTNVKMLQSFPYLMRSVQKRSYFGVSNLEERTARNVWVFHDSQLAVDLSIFVELATVGSQCALVGFVFQINLSINLRMVRI